ncbi:hypothetical protein F4805DRAFT_423765 [Annulohypoxylon moriforme]|nr:hypothetical protein F4805DRAFT_423765 [Annulohypoxylon moriforme]
MPPRITRPNANAGEDINLSRRDIQLVAVAWCCVKSSKDDKPVIDFAKFTLKAGYKTQDSARHSWRPVEKKLEAIVAQFDDGSAPPSAPSTPVKSAKSAPPKRKKELGNGDVAKEGVPVKKARHSLPMGSMTSLKKAPARKVKKEEPEGSTEDSWNEYASFSEVDDGEA